MFKPEDYKERGGDPQFWRFMADINNKILEDRLPQYLIDNGGTETQTAHVSQDGTCSKTVKAILFPIKFKCDHVTYYLSANPGTVILLDKESDRSSFCPKCGEKIENV